MTELFFGLFLISSLVLAWKSYKDGVKAGAEQALEILHRNKVIC